jgi:uncharacterized membrane protein (UPF0127 family)
LQPTFVAAAIAIAFAGACQDERAAVVLQPKAGQPVTVYVEVADTPDTQTRGLMYRTHLARDGGMIFLFDREQNQSFWMKNTPLPLDLIFISRDGRIAGIHANAVPFSLEPIAIGAPSRAVLEVNAGFAAAHGLARGDPVTYRNIRSTKLP